MRGESLIGSGPGQQRRLLRMELLIDGGQDESRPGVVPHQRGQLEDAAPAEELDGAAERARAKLARAEQLATAADDQRFFLSKPGDRPTALDHIDDFRLETLF